MNTKTLISTLALTLALGTLALPGTASARDDGNDRDRQEHSRDRHDNGRNDHGDSRGHDNNRQHQERDHYRHDNGHHYGQIRWAPYIPKYQPKQRVYTTHYDSGYYDPSVILRVETHW